jgi:hypothetical protein
MGAELLVVENQFPLTSQPDIARTPWITTPRLPFDEFPILFQRRLILSENRRKSKKGLREYAFSRLLGIVADNLLRASIRMISPGS